MQLRVSKASEVPVHQQLVEQVVFLIGSEKLEPGEALPSVRELARRLKIHHNTVSEAYQELVRRGLLVRKPGSRLKVCSQQGASLGPVQDVDDFINASIRIARNQGYSLQSLREHVRNRLLAEPPDHILVVAQGPGLRRLLQEEIGVAGRWPVQSCSVNDLAGDRGLLIGALVVVPEYSIGQVDPLLPKDRPAISIAFRSADEHLEQILRLKQSSVIGAVSVSGTVLRTCRAIFASAVGSDHTLVEFRLPLKSPRALDGIDLVFCDSIAFRTVKHRHAIHYRLIAPESLDYIAGTMQAYQRVKK